MQEQEALQRKHVRESRTTSSYVPVSTDTKSTWQVASSVFGIGTPSLMTPHSFITPTYVDTNKYLYLYVGQLKKLLALPHLPTFRLLRE